jgi:hypothetical protein
VLRLHHILTPLRSDPRQQAKYQFRYQICQKLWYTNNAVNFFLYSLSGKSFRSDLIGLFRRFSLKCRQLCCGIKVEVYGNKVSSMESTS